MFINVTYIHLTMTVAHLQMSTLKVITTQGNFLQSIKYSETDRYVVKTKLEKSNQDMIPRSDKAKIKS